MNDLFTQELKLCHALPIQYEHRSTVDTIRRANEQTSYRGRESQLSFVCSDAPTQSVYWKCSSGGWDMFIWFEWMSYRIDKFDIKKNIRLILFGIFSFSLLISHRRSNFEFFRKLIWVIETLWQSLVLSLPNFTRILIEILCHFFHPENKLYL